jgi:hypothetical protein
MLSLHEPKRKHVLRITRHNIAKLNILITTNMSNDFKKEESSELATSDKPQLPAGPIFDSESC